MDDHHLNAEQLSRLLDEPPADEEAEHLEGCRRCSRELEGFRRMRMALSAMDQEDPPPGEWGAIEKELRSSGVLGRNGGDHQVGTDWSVGGSWASGWPARAAAAALVFGVGLAAGLQFDVGGSVGTTAGAEEDRAERTVVESSAGTEDGAGSFAGGIAGLLAEESGDDSVSPVEDPVMAAEELARLDALARAVRERLRQNPADPELNDLLFRISDRRESLTEEFGRAAQLVSLDYR
jgi:hypothetical protein